MERTVKSISSAAGAHRIPPDSQTAQRILSLIANIVAAAQLHGHTIETDAAGLAAAVRKHLSRRAPCRTCCGTSAGVSSVVCGRVSKYGSRHEITFGPEQRGQSGADEQLYAAEA